MACGFYGQSAADDHEQSLSVLLEQLRWVQQLACIAQAAVNTQIVRACVGSSIIAHMYNELVRCMSPICPR